MNVQTIAPTRADERKIALVHISCALNGIHELFCKITSSEAAAARHRLERFKLEKGKKVDGLRPQIERIDAFAARSTELSRAEDLEDLGVALVRYGEFLSEISEPPQDEGAGFDDLAWSIGSAAADECLPLTVKLKSVLHIARAYPAEAARRANKIIVDAKGR